jgi:hypothetical protein
MIMQITTAAMRSSVAFLLTAVFLTGGCDGDGTLPPIDVTELTAEEITARAFSAATRPDSILHLKYELSAAAASAEQRIHAEIWIDADIRRAREEWNGEVAYVQVNECGVNLRKGNRAYGHTRAEGGSRDPFLASTLEYLRLLESSEGTREISAATKHGKPVILIETTTDHFGDFAGRYVTRIYLDDAYLPVAHEVAGAGSRSTLFTTLYTYEFLHDDMSPSFFSIESLPDSDLSRVVLGRCEVLG